MFKNEQNSQKYMCAYVHMPYTHIHTRLTIPTLKSRQELLNPSGIRGPFHLLQNCICRMCADASCQRQMCKPFPGTSPLPWPQCHLQKMLWAWSKQVWTSALSQLSKRKDVQPANPSERRLFWTVPWSQETLSGWSFPALSGYHYTIRLP